MELRDLQASQRKMNLTFDEAYCLRPYRTEILRSDSVVIETVHFEIHFMSLSEETATPEWIVSIRTDS